MDEGQDFSDAWRDLVLRHADEDARLLWVEDPMQNLYGKPRVALPGWVTLHADRNYRSPHAVVRLLRHLMPPDQDIEARGPIHGGDIETLVYASPEELEAHTKKAISHCLAAGFRRGDIAVLSFHGRDHSALLRAPQLGPHTLRAFTGRYDMFGLPDYTPGDVLIESVYRFKGQAAPAVILTEVDFEALDDKARRKLFVGATRAMLKLVIVASQQAMDAGLAAMLR